MRRSLKYINPTAISRSSLIGTESKIQYKKEAVMRIAGTLFNYSGSGSPFGWLRFPILVAPAPPIFVAPAPVSLN